MGLLLYSLMAYIAPAILAHVDLSIAVVFTVLILSILEPGLKSRRPVKLAQSPVNGMNDQMMQLRSTATVAIASWIVIIVLDIYVSIHIVYESVEGAVFLTPDLSYYLSAIQSIGTGEFPPPDLLHAGTSLLENPAIMTLSFGYAGVLIAITGLQNSGEVFLIVLKALCHSMLAPAAYYVVRKMKGRAPTAILLGAIAGLGIGLDFAPFEHMLGQYWTFLYRGIAFQYTALDGTTSVAYVPGAGYDALLTSFHHLQPVILFLFAVGILLSSPKPLMHRHKGLAVLITVLLPFYHLGVGTSFALPTAIAMIGIMVAKVASRTGTHGIFLLLKSLVALALVGLFLASDLLSPLLFIVPQIPSTEMFQALFMYLGPLAILGPIGYYHVCRMENSPAKWVSIVSVDFLLLFNLFFSTSRDFGAGVMPTIYFSLQALQVSIALMCLLGFSVALGVRIESGDISSGDAQMLLPRVRRGAYIGLVAFLVLSSMTTSGHLVAWIAQTNYGDFTQVFYGPAPAADQQERAMLNWIYENSNSSDVILCDVQNWEMSALISRQILYSAYRTPNPEDPAYQAYLSIYESSTIEEALPYLESYEVFLVVVSPLERAHFPYGCFKFYTSVAFELVYSNGGYDVFRIH